MEGDILFLQHNGDFVSTAISFALGDSFDMDDVDEILQEIEVEIIEAPRANVIHEENNERIVAYPITAYVKRGIKSVIKHTHFDSRESYNNFLDAVNSRRNDFIVLNKNY